MGRRSTGGIVGRSLLYRRGGAVAAAGAVIVATVGLLAAPASAHTAKVSGVETCPGQNHLVTWTISNDFHTAAHIDSAVATLGGDTFSVDGLAPNPVPPNNGTATATTTVPGDRTGTITLTIHATWPDGFQQTAHGSVDLSPPCNEST